MPSMSTEIARLETPIDVMYLIHKALRTEAARVEDMVRRFQLGHSLQPIRSALESWRSAFAFHAGQEDRYLTSALPGFKAARVNQVEHMALREMLADLTGTLTKDDSEGLNTRLNDATVAPNKQQHARLIETLGDVMAVPNDELNTAEVIARTGCHLCLQVLAVRVAQDIHLKNEEAFVLPAIRRRVRKVEQLAIARRLLVDKDASDQRWVIEWVAQHLSWAERHLVADLERRFSEIPSGAS